MSAKIVKLKLVNVGRMNRIAVNKVIKGAANAKLHACVVIGAHEDGTTYLASTDNAADTLWAMEHAKLWLMNGCPEQDSE